MKSQLSAIVVTLVLVGPALAGGSDPQNVGPERPDEAFTVFVFSSLEDEEDTKYKAKKVKQEVEKRIKSHKHWFIVAKNSDFSRVASWISALASSSCRFCSSSVWKSRYRA